MKFEKRKDFLQVLATTINTHQETNICLQEMFEDAEVTFIKQS